MIFIQGNNMYEEPELSYLSLSVSSKNTESLAEIASTLAINIQDFNDKELFINALDENGDFLIILDTDMGVDAIIQTLNDMQNDNIALVVLSQLADNGDLSERLKDFNVISILAYDNWQYQLSALLKYLGGMRQTKQNESFVENEEGFIDTLTDLLNWKNAPKIFNSLVHDNKESNRPFSMIMFDIDKLADINQEYGKDIADEVIVSIASIAQKNIRRYDSVLRISEDKFAVFLSGANLEIAKTKAQSFGYEMEIKGHGFDKIKATACFAVIEYKQEQSLEELTNEGYLLLAKAKKEGPNTIESEMA